MTPTLEKRLSICIAAAIFTLCILWLLLQHLLSVIGTDTLTN